MPPRWTRTLAAFDRDVASVPTRLEKYERFVASVLRELNRGIKRAHPDVPTLEVRDQEPWEGTPFGGRWVAVGSGDDGVDLVVWPSAPWGGPPGAFAVGVFLDPRSAMEEELTDDLAVVAASVREATGAVPADGVVDPRSGRPAPCAAFATVPIDGDGFVGRLVGMTLRFDRAAGHAQEALNARRSGSSLRWVRERLRDRDDEDLARVAVGTRVDATLGWLGKALPTNLRVWAPGVPLLLFEVHGPAGRLTFRDGRKTSRRHVQAVCKALGHPYAEVDGFHGGVLLDDDEARRLHAEGRSDEVHARIKAAWEAHVARGRASRVP